MQWKQFGLSMLFWSNDGAKFCGNEEAHAYPNHGWVPRSPRVRRGGGFPQTLAWSPLYQYLNRGVYQIEHVTYKDT